MMRAWRPHRQLAPGIGQIAERMGALGDALLSRRRLFESPRGDRPAVTFRQVEWSGMAFLQFGTATSQLALFSSHK
ncbi:Hypothetical protein NTJ_08860 [Nesidiocoris tenuis]|uniref:Uncharacterized protein n=1 Tax=Nesidiocoris tenuis TaxID=355587 RepID=A0ABN7AV47_9HEMI|nr:Hypothetical protein NTJ_08860 [Nesidiocoris tenuis]